MHPVVWIGRALSAFGAARAATLLTALAQLA